MSAAPAEPTRPNAVDRARALGDLIVEHRLEGDVQRRLPAPLVTALIEAGLMRLCVPEIYGGPEADPVTLISVIKELGRHDCGTAWCAMIASTTASMAAFLPADTALEIYGPADVVTGGVFAPNGTGVATTLDGEDGFMVSGRWAWGSGTQHSDWVPGGARCDDDTFRLCWLRKDDVAFHDTWAQHRHAWIGLTRLLGRWSVRAGPPDDPAGRDSSGRRLGGGAVSPTSLCSRRRLPPSGSDSRAAHSTSSPPSPREGARSTRRGRGGRTPGRRSRSPSRSRRARPTA
jgi:hypothetical protein